MGVSSLYHPLSAPSRSAIHCLPSHILHIAVLTYDFTLRQLEVQFGTASKAFETHLMASDESVPLQRSKHEHRY